MRSTVSVGLLVLLSGCAATASSTGETAVQNPPAATPPETDEPPPDPLQPFEPAAFIEAYARPRIAVLAATGDEPASIDRQLARARDLTTRRELARASVIAHLRVALAAGDSASRESQRRAMARASRIAARGNPDARTLAELAFADVYLAYVSGAADRADKAEAFFTNHVVDRELLRVDTMIRGELALEAGNAVRARQAFTVLRGDPSDPLTGYALYRSATTYCRAGETVPCRLLLDATRRNGCGPAAPDEARALGERAFVELALPRVRRRDRVESAPPYCTRYDVASFSDPHFGR